MSLKKSCQKAYGRFYGYWRLWHNSRMNIINCSEKRRRAQCREGDPCGSHYFTETGELRREKEKDSKFTWQTVLDNFVNSSFFAAYLLFRASWRTASTLGFKARPVAAYCGQLRWFAIFSAKMPVQWTALRGGHRGAPAPAAKTQRNKAAQGATSHFRKKPPAGWASVASPRSLQNVAPAAKCIGIAAKYG
jgi:hypothetical protein